MSLLTRALALLFLLTATSGLHAVPPVISTFTENVGADGSVTLNVNVTSNGAATTVTWQYGLSDAYGSTASPNPPYVPVVPATAVNQTVSTSLAGLIGGQTYHYKVTARNGSTPDATSTDLTFTTATYAPKLTLLDSTHTNNMIHGTVTANGTAGKAFFLYGLSSPGNTPSSPKVDIAAGDINKAIDFTLPTEGTYYYRLVFDTNDDGIPEFETDEAVSNEAPIAEDDTAKYVGGATLTIEVLENDVDADGDELEITNISAPKHGTADPSADKQSIIYTPNASFHSSDSFTYTIDDGFGGISSARVTVLPLVTTLAGTHGALVKKANGKETGYFTFTATSSGAFTGIALIDGERYVVMGVLAADGSYRGFAYGKHGSLPVRLATVAGDTGSVVTATFGNGSYVADLVLDDTDGTTRAELYGRYTASLGAGGSGSSTDGNDSGNTPGGTGWLAIRVSPDGTSKVKGRLLDGRSFSVKGAVSIIDGVPTLTFYKETNGNRVVGSVTLAETVGGTMRTDQHASGDGPYPRGFDATQAVSGARYTPPESGKRALDTDTSKGQNVTVNFSGGGLSAAVALNVVLNDRDRVEKITNPGSADLNLKIDRKGGRFSTKISVGNEGKRLKADGVIIQATSGGGGGRGAGIFTTSNDTGTVTISSTTSVVSPDPTEPTTPPVTDPDPADPADPTDPVDGSTGAIELADPSFTATP